MSGKKRIDLLLLGKTGNGKSATGNTILRRKAFESSASSSSVTKTVSAEVCEYKENIIKVVDGPGIGDTRLNDEGAMNLVMEEMRTAIQMNPSGYHAFVLVIRFGTRITKEDGEAVELLKTIFGPLFVRKHCILLFTHGDDFEDSDEKTGETFQQWYMSQEGTLKDIIEECCERVVLFDNRSKDDQKIFAQIDSLLMQLENLQMHGNRYSDENFEKARDAREKAKVMAKEPYIREETMAETSLLFQKLDQIQKTDTLLDKLPPLEELKSRTDALCESIKKKDNGTGALHKLAGTVESLKQAVYNEADVTNRMIEDDKQRKAEEKKQREEREAAEKKYMEEQEALKRKMDENRKEYKAMLADQEKKRKGEKEKNDKELAKLTKEMQEQEAKFKEEVEKRRNETRKEEEKRKDADKAWEKKLKDLNDENKNMLQLMAKKFEKLKTEQEIRLIQDTRPYIPHYYPTPTPSEKSSICPLF